MKHLPPDMFLQSKEYISAIIPEITWHRHPCAGRGPHDDIRIKNQEIRIKSFSFLNSIILILISTLWIPAFAGMTAEVGYKNSSGAKRETI